MKFMYFFDNNLKRFTMYGKRMLHSAATGYYKAGIRALKQDDVNVWFYTKGDQTIAVDLGHLDFFTQNPVLNIKSPIRLKDIIENSTVEVVCTGHSGIWDYTPRIFAHIDESAKSSIGRPFDPSAPKSIRK
ncbi:MAG: hypothetical protein E7386_07115 [Ruminococcaceae bacterium]|nr:hypothetical protein [Oscillospiraceae bacterium]